MKLNVLLVSWEKVFSEGMAHVLKTNPHVGTVTVCTDGVEAVAVAAETKPELILIDMGVKGRGFVELSQRLKELLPDTRIAIIVSAYLTQNLSTVLSAAADIFIDKEITVPMFNNVVARCLDSQYWEEAGVGLCPMISKQIVEEFRRFAPLTGEETRPDTFSLTRREKEVARLVAEDRSNKEIAETLFISEHTVKVHLKSIFDKVHLHSRDQLANMAVRNRALFGMDDSSASTTGAGPQA